MVPVPVMMGTYDAGVHRLQVMVAATKRRPSARLRREKMASEQTTVSSITPMQLKSASDMASMVDTKIMFRWSTSADCKYPLAC